MKLTIPKFKDMHYLHALLGYAAFIYLLSLWTRKLGPDKDLLMVCVWAIGFLMLPLVVFIWGVFSNKEARFKAEKKGEPKLSDFPRGHTSLILFGMKMKQYNCVPLFAAMTANIKENLAEGTYGFNFPMPVALVEEAFEKNHYYVLVFDRKLTEDELKLWQMFKIGFHAKWAFR